MAEARRTRPVSWLKAALHEFEKFPEGAKSVCLAALTIAGKDGKADIAKPLQGLGSGVLEVALPSKEVVQNGSRPHRRIGEFLRGMAERDSALCTF